MQERFISDSSRHTSSHGLECRTIVEHMFGIIKSISVHSDTILVAVKKPDTMRGIKSYCW